MATKKTAAKPKQPKLPSGLRGLVAHNFALILAYKHGKKTHRQLMTITGLKGGTFGRVIRGESGLTLETIEQVAKAVELQPYQLLLSINDARTIPVAVPGNVDPNLAAAWPHISVVTRKRMVEDALNEATTSLKETSDLLDRFRTTLKQKS